MTWLNYITDTSQNKHQGTIHKIYKWIHSEVTNTLTLLFTRKVFSRHNLSAQVFFSISYGSSSSHIHLQVIFIIKSSSLSCHLHQVWIIIGSGSSQDHHQVWIITWYRASLDHHWIIIKSGSSLDLDRHLIIIKSGSSLDLNGHCWIITGAI